MQYIIMYDLLSDETLIRNVQEVCVCVCFYQVHCTCESVLPQCS